MKLKIGIVCLLCFFSVSAQEMTAYLSKRLLRIGEQSELTLELKKASDTFELSPWRGELDCLVRQKGEKLWKAGARFEVLMHRDTFIKQKQTWRRTYTLTIWDTGVFQLPVINYVLGSASKKIEIPEITVVFKKKQADFSIEETKVLVENDSWAWFKKYGAFIILGLIVLIGFFFWNRKRRLTKDDNRSYKEKTLDAIAELRKQKLWINSQERHYVEYARILRRFLTNRYEVNFMGRTSEESILLLRKLDLHDSELGKIKTVLSQSDFIKFGKQEQSEEQILQNLISLEELVAILSPLDLIEKNG